MRRSARRRRRSLTLTAAEVDRLYEELWRIASCGRRGAVTAAAWLRNRSRFQPQRTIAFEGEEADAVGHARTAARLVAAERYEPDVALEHDRNLARLVLDLPALEECVRSSRVSQCASAQKALPSAAYHARWNVQPSSRALARMSSVISRSRVSYISRAVRSPVGAVKRIHICREGDTHP